MPPEVRIGLISAAVVATIAVLLLVFGDRPELAAAIRRWLAGRTTVDMSSSDDALAAPIRSAKPVLDQSAPTSLHAQTSTPASGGLEAPNDRDSSDMDAEQTTWELPRISRYLKDDEFIIFLASQKLHNGKYRLSANDIVKTVRGDRNEVLAIVRQVREPAPEFPPLSDEQQRLRQRLQLDQR